MKKTVLAALALMLLTALTVSALAGADVRVAKESAKVYAERDTDSEVLKKLRKGATVLVDVDYGSWVGILVEADDGQTLGWVKSKYLRCKHDWTDWQVKRKATCSRAGLKERYCTRCGEVEDKEIPRLEHQFGKWYVERRATCAREGLKVRTCKVCGYEEDKTYTEPHDFGSWTITAQPTCTETGSRKRTCRVCGYVERQTIDKLPHDFEYEIIEEATDHSSGIRAKVCQVCGYTEDATSYDPEGTLRRRDRGDAVLKLQQLLVEQGYLNAGGADGVYGGGTEKAIMKYQKDQGLNPDGVAWPQTQKRLQHDFGPWETVKALTRSEPGERQRVCRDCGYIQRETIEAGEVIERGARGEKVRALQQILKKLGYEPGGTDGIYGRKLDTAFQSFENSIGMTFEPGKVRPADVDALFNAWLEADDAGMKTSALNSPVNLALTVTPAADELSDNSATTYTWTLANLGTQKCNFNALLLTYGKRPDFSGDNLVMVVDGLELKPNSKNIASGSFVVAKDWGEGNLNFAAMAVSENSGEKWLSNTVVFTAAASGESQTVAPIPTTLNLSSLSDGVYAVAFDPGDIASVTSGIFMNALWFYTADIYDDAAVKALMEGDTVVVNGREMAVTEVRFRRGRVDVNGGVNAEGGCAFVAQDGGGWRVMLEEDHPVYTEQGSTTLKVDRSARYLEGGVVYAAYDGLVDAIQSSGDTYSQYNTTVTVENGKVIEINHR